MRILHLVHQYLPDHVGGTELYTQWLTKALSRQGHDISIFYRRSAAGEGLKHRLAGRVQLWTAWDGVLNPSSRFLATLKRNRVLEQTFDGILEQVQPEIVHIEHLMGHPTGLVKAIQQRGIPYVITLWDFWWVCANAQLLTNYSQELCDGPERYLNCARCTLARADRAQLRPIAPLLAGPLLWRNHRLARIMTAANTLIAPTEFVRTWYESHGAPADRLVVVEPGLENPAPFDRQTREAGAPLRFAYIGGLSWQKGVHVLLEAFNRLEDEAELWIAGDETADPAYVAQLHRSAPASVRFLGKLSRDEVWQTLAQVDVLVIPSIWYETFAFVVSEAFAAGVPVIASRLGPLADRVHHEKDGLLVPPGNVEAMAKALTRFQQESTLLPRLQAGIQPVHTMEKHAEDIETLYRAAIA